MLGLFALATSALATPDHGVPTALLSKFTRGVNVTRWFCYLDNPGDTKHFDTYFGDDDIAALKKIKVTYVRLCLSPEAIYDKGKSNATTLTAVDKALDRLQGAGFAVLFDLHDNGQLKLDTSGDENGFVSFWEGVARHYRGKRLNDVVFELLNEPTFASNPQKWYALQDRTVSAIRKIDPKRTIMVSGTQWSGVDSLAPLKPLAAKNLIYTFHCYDPFPFTHQGASWAGTAADLKDIPFPSSPEALAPVWPTLKSPASGWARDYGDGRFDAAYVRSRIQTASEWAKKNGVPIVLGEFGAYPPVAPADSRARWFSAMYKAVTEFGMPDALWGYDDALGLGRRREKDGSLWLDPLVLRVYYGIRP